MLGFDGLYQDRDGDHRYDDPGLTLYRTWLQVAPGIVFGDDMGDWWKAIDEGRYLTYQSSLLLRAFQGDAAGAPLGSSEERRVGKEGVRRCRSRCSRVP